MYTEEQFKSMEKNIGSIDFLKAAGSVVNKILVQNNLVTEDKLKQMLTDELTFIIYKMASEIDPINKQEIDKERAEYIKKLNEPLNDKTCKYCCNNPCTCGATPTPKSDVPAHSSVALTDYEWHLLLSELEHSMRFVNRDTKTVVMIYEKIASQLNGAKVTMTLNKES